MLKDDLEVGVLGDEGPERREELGLSVHDGHAVGGAAGDFAVQVEDDAFFFHGLEDVVEGVEGEDAPFGVGGGAFGVGLGVCEFWEGGGGKGGGGATLTPAMPAFLALRISSGVMLEWR